MSWKLYGRTFRISCGILSSMGYLPLDRFWRHVSYLMLVNGPGIRGTH